MCASDIFENSVVRQYLIRHFNNFYDPMTLEFIDLDFAH